MDTPETPATPPATGDNQDDTQNIEVELTPQEYKALLAERDAQIKKLNNEAMEKRRQRNEAQKQAEEAERQRRLLAGEYEPVVNDLTAKVKELEPYRERYELIQAHIIETNTKRIAEMPDLYRDLVPHGTPEEVQQWLDVALPKLTIQRAPDLDPGKRGNGGKPTVQLTPLEIEAAIKMGFTPSEYAQIKGETQG